MPKELHSTRGMDYYRSPSMSSNNLVYPPISSRPAPYYEPIHNTMPHPYAPMPSYATGGPVQQPPLSLPTQSYGQSLQPIRPSSGAWNPVDDRTLMAARKQGMNWAPIQQTYFPNKTPNACRKRHERLMERQSTDDWNNVKTESLAKHYMDMRKEIWSGLAAATGEKWNVVEQKCMSSGLKNMQTAARAYARRERMLESGGQAGNASYSDPHEYDIREDSGISIDLEAEYDHDNGSEASTNDPLNHGQPHYSYAPNVQPGDRPDGYPQPDRNDGYPSDRHDGYPQSDQDRYHQESRGSFHSRLPSMDMGIDAIINRPNGL
ncbi:hypothetical protein ACMFMG_001979 [Clarireedia jacksonii]